MGQPRVVGITKGEEEPCDHLELLVFQYKNVKNKKKCSASHLKYVSSLEFEDGAMADSQIQMTLGQHQL